MDQIQSITLPVQSSVAIFADFELGRGTETQKPASDVAVLMIPPKDYLSELRFSKWQVVTLTPIQVHERE